MLFPVPCRLHSTQKAQHRSAFTAVELLVVIAIIAILSVLASVLPVRNMLRQAALDHSVTLIKSALVVDELPPGHDPNETLGEDDRIILWVRFLRQSATNYAAENIADEDGNISSTSISALAATWDIDVDEEQVTEISVADLGNPFSYESLVDYTVQKCTENEVHHGQLNALIAKLNGNNPKGFIKVLETDALRDSKRSFNANLALELKIAFYLSTNEIPLPIP